MKDALGKDGEGIDVRFEFDQSPYVTRAVAGVVTEGLFGAVLVGLMILLFLRDWRSALVVVLNIPLALMAAVFALWLTGQTINLMTLGGLALAIGILVDEATVEIENIHTQLRRGLPPAQAVLEGAARNGRSAAVGDAVHSGGFRVVVLHARGGTLVVRAAVAGGRICDDRVLYVVEHVCAGAVACGC